MKTRLLVLFAVASLLFSGPIIKDKSLTEYFCEYGCAAGGMLPHSGPDFDTCVLQCMIRMSRGKKHETPKFY